MGSISKRRREHSDEVNMKGNEDKISNLPTSLIGHILSFLPTKNAVATSVLSTKWKYLWTSITNLDFDDELVVVPLNPVKNYKERQSLVEMSFINFVYRALAQNVLDLQKFRLRCIRSYDLSHLKVWVSTALSRNVRELNLSGIQSLPRELFTCSSLVVLKLRGTFCGTSVLNVPTLVSLQCLKILVIDSLGFVDDDSIYRLFSSCPLLEDLSIQVRDWRNVSAVNISAHSLKSLNINGWIWNQGYLDHYNLQIVLNTPNLQHLKYCGRVAKGYTLNKLNSLVKADINFFRSSISSQSTDKLVAEFIKRMSKVQWLYLSNASIEAFRLWRFSLPKFDHLTYLELDHEYVGWKLLLDFVESSPLLETLIVWELAEYGREENQTTSCWYQPKNVPPCLWFHLKKIEIKWFEGELKMIEYFLKNSRFLEKLTIHHSQRIGELEFYKKVLMLPRGSQACQVEVL